jgi:hypothetical protein
MATARHIAWPMAAAQAALLLTDFSDVVKQ